MIMDRVAAHTLVGAPNECWHWGASCLPNGRPRLGIRVNGRNVSATVARVIVADREGLTLSDGGRSWVARHTCDVLWCVNPAHIIYGTYAQNTADMWERGRGARGDRRPSSKLGVEGVRDIRASVGKESQASIARRLGVSQALVSLVANGKVWGWVE